MPAVRASLGALGSALALSGCAYVARQLTVAYLKVDALTSPKEIAIELDRPIVHRALSEPGHHRRPVHRRPRDCGAERG